MESFEVLRHVTIGQYLPAESVIHRLDPRAKITVVLLLIVAVTFSTSYTAHLALIALTLGIIAIAHLPVRYLLSGIRPALPIIVLLALMQLFVYGEAAASATGARTVLWQWGWLRLTTGSLRLTLVSLARLFELLLLVSLLTNATPST
ncbi:MAG: CbiQ family ECF transporter T component, partial [Anaerolineae bacterium]|nr:CbiQ family ECF transporter T component [Anaerolineae bacterium]